MKNLFYIIILVIFTNCLGSKTVSESSIATKEVDKSEKVKDSVSTKDTNKAIDDKIVTPVPQTGNAEMDARFDALLSAMNTSKSSGDNSYKRYYDQKTRELIEEFKIGETSSEKTDVNESEKIEKTFEEQQNEYFKKKITTMPWYLWLALFIFLWPTIWKFLKPIIQVATGPANIVTGVSNLIKPKK